MVCSRNSNPTIWAVVVWESKKNYSRIFIIFSELIELSDELNFFEFDWNTSNENNVRKLMGKQSRLFFSLFVQHFKDSDPFNISETNVLCFGHCDRLLHDT